MLVAGTSIGSMLSTTRAARQGSYRRARIGLPARHNTGGLVAAGCPRAAEPGGSRHGVTGCRGVGEQQSLQVAVSSAAALYRPFERPAELIVGPAGIALGPSLAAMSNSVDRATRPACQTTVRSGDIGSTRSTDAARPPAVCQGFLRSEGAMTTTDVVIAHARQRQWPAREAAPTRNDRSAVSTTCPMEARPRYAGYRST